MPHADARAMTVSECFLAFMKREQRQAQWPDCTVVMRETKT